MFFFLDALDIRTVALYVVPPCIHDGTSLCSVLSVQSKYSMYHTFIVGVTVNRARHAGPIPPETNGGEREINGADAPTNRYSAKYPVYPTSRRQ